MGPNFFFNAFENFTAMLNFKMLYMKISFNIQMKLLVVVFYSIFSLLSRGAEYLFLSY